jgi:hypothetical protein
VRTIADEPALQQEARERARALVLRAGLDRADGPVTTVAYE